MGKILLRKSRVSSVAIVFNIFFGEHHARSLSWPSYPNFPSVASYMRPTQVTLIWWQTPTPRPHQHADRQLRMDWTPALSRVKSLSLATVKQTSVKMEYGYTLSYSGVTFSKMAAPWHRWTRANVAQGLVKSSSEFPWRHPAVLTVCCHWPAPQGSAAHSFNFLPSLCPPGSSLGLDDRSFGVGESWRHVCCWSNNFHCPAISGLFILLSIFTFKRGFNVRLILNL